MAENKNKVIWYTNWGETFLKLTDDEAGKLIKHFSGYVLDQHPEPTDRLTELLFDPMEDTLKRDLKKYEKIVDRNRENGKKGGAPKKNPKKPNGIKDNPNKADSDNDNDTDKDKVIDTDNEISILRGKLESKLGQAFTWQESVIRNMKGLGLDTNQLKVQFNIALFCNKLEAEEDVYKSLREIKTHFTRWYKLELKNATTNKTKDTRYESTLDQNSETAKQLGLDQ